MAQGIPITKSGSDYFSGAALDLPTQAIDAKTNTHICTSPFALTANGLAIEQTSAYLIMVSGGIPGTMFRLSEDTSTFGRAPDCTHPLHEITVSRTHAVFSIDPGGAVYVRDEASTNGTFVNGARLPARTPALLQDGDRIQLGKTVILKLVRLDSHDEEFQREMFERTVRDALTALYNRAYFLSQIRHLLDRNAALGIGLAVIMLDVDHFKSVNDSYGHCVGDNVLKEVAAVLRESTRSEDLVARFGGEEFIVALPVATVGPAAARAERIRRSLARRRIAAGAGEISVTASLGVSFDPSSRTRNVHALISTADHALYQAKTEGRNRVILAPPTALEPLVTESSDSL
jgi:diguanylate cyclase (GGDEF)-like protein